ncbi:MAG: hypothetical protein NTY01_06860, partial [Verrucomicrobia bacterium]|nr:hypothetical protein [Verrucomicrobiota bacterium]
LTVTNGSVAGPPAHWHVVYSGSYLVSADGGINYTTYDVLTAIDGDGTPFTVTVTAVDEGDGHIVSSTLLAAGDYTTKPTDPVSLSGGTGSGAKAQPGVDQMWELFEP